MKGKLDATDFLEIMWVFDWSKKEMLAERNNLKKGKLKVDSEFNFFPSVWEL